jgi:LysR family transcriptional regulator, regulator of abg operon
VKLQRIEHFLEVAAAGSIRGAARRLGVSQPGLTRSMQQLEDELGIQLVRRDVRGASLTPAGSTFLAHARLAHAELGRAVEEARRSIGEATGLVTVGLSPVSARLLLPEFVTSFLRQHSTTRVRVLELEPSALLPMVREGTVDIAVTQRTAAHLDAGLEYHPLFHVQLRVGACSGHPLAGTRELAELARASWIAPAAPGISDDIMTQSFRAIGLPAPVPAVHCASYHSAVEIAATSRMLLPIPPPLLRKCVADGVLSEIALTKPLAPLRLGLHTRAGSPPLPVTKAAAQLIRAIARRIAASGELRAKQ